MRAVNRVGGTERLTFRDKRLIHPPLYVDLREKAYRTNVWEPGRLIVENFDGLIATGEAFAGVMRIGDSPKSYLLEGKVIRNDVEKKRLAAIFHLLNPDGQKILTQYFEGYKPESGKMLPSLLFSIAYRTINWSLSGFLIGNYHGDLTMGSQFSGIMRIEKSDKSALFRAETKRMVSSCSGLAAGFNNFGLELFDLFELAMKKSSEPPPESWLSEP